jgi:SAM-dependent methyltransferase
MPQVAPSRADWSKLAYEALAPAYDEFTADYDHELWLGNLLPKLERHGVEGHRLLDVGCGTGKSFLPMLERGWEVTACDISPSMLDLARAKVGPRARLYVADMRDLPQLGEFDVAWALDDAVNYLLSNEELESALRGIGRNLAPGGLLMFDLNTLYSYRTFFAESKTIERPGRRMLWQGQAPSNVAAGSVCEARFESEDLTSPPSGGHVPPHLHRQRHFTEATVLSTFERTDLECLDVYGHGYDAVPQQPLDELVHEKAVFIARRNPKEEP